MVKKTGKNKSKILDGTREIFEYFRIKLNGKEKTIRKKGFEKVQEKPSKKQVLEENKILKNVFLTLGILIVVIFGIYYIFYSSNNFEYKNIKFDVLKEGEIIFYHTSFPAFLDGREVNYNVYIRNDPRKLVRKVPFEKKGLYLLEMMVVNNTESFSCEGYGGISMFNLQQVLNTFGVNLIQDPEASCDLFGRYGYLQIESGNETRIDQFGPACYKLQVNNCEILEVTERFLVEALVKEIGKDN